MYKGFRITGDDDYDWLTGRDGRDYIRGLGGDDLLFGKGGADVLSGGMGFDYLSGGSGNDRIYGGADNDNLYGGRGNDRLHGDSGAATAKGSDLGADNLQGGRGHDTLVQSDGNDAMSGGSGRDTFLFKWQDPMVALAVGTGRAFTTISDFDASDDRLVFDVAGLGKDAKDANFIDGGDGTAMGQAATFFSGAAGQSNGEAVMVLTETGFATGADAVVAAQDEAMGDFIVYFNTTANVASLLFVDAPDVAHSIARFSSIDTLADLGAAGLGAGDFLFA